METTETPLVELQQLEDDVRRSDGDGLHARWKSGRRLLALKIGKQLPKGVLEELAAKLGVARAEINARMKFASKYSEAELSAAIIKFPTWHAMTHAGLTDAPRVPKTARDADSKHEENRLRRVLEIVKSIEPADLKDDELIGAIDTEVQRLWNQFRILNGNQKAVA
jgi:hypothetical protein